MKKKYGFILISTFFLLGSWVMSVSIGAPALTYVYSSSMEPSIPVNDGFFVMPSASYQVGDIVVFEPEVINAERVTHRLKALGGNGWITKGDNVAQTDQETGEPEVPESRIIGKVFTINNQPITIKNLGIFIEWLNETELTVRIVGGILVITGVLWMWKEQVAQKYDRRKKKRVSLVQMMNRIIIIVMIGLFLLLSGISKKETVRFLISENPSNDTEQFLVNVPGEMTYAIQNVSFFPVWYFPTVTEPLAIQTDPILIPPYTEMKTTLSIPAYSKTGWRKGVLSSYIYPAIIPRRVIAAAHHLHPLIGNLLLSLTVGGVLWGLSKLFVYWFKLYPKMPLKALNRKEARQTWKQIKATFKWSRRG